MLVGSLLGHIAVPEMTPYVVSKWGVRALARQLSLENVDLPHVQIAHVAPGSVDTPIYDYAALRAGHVITGPAVIEVPTTTVVVPDGRTGTVDALGNLHISQTGA